MEKNLAGLVLAAGSSQRMGDINKLLLPNGEQSIIRTVLSNLIESAVEQVFVVLGHQHEFLHKEIEDLSVNTIINPDFLSGMGSSISLGIHKIFQEGYRACMLCLGDLPFLESRHFVYMANAYLKAPTNKIYAPFYQGKQGHPLIFSRPWFQRLSSLHDDKGAKQILRENSDSIIRLDFDDLAGLEDVDTYEQYQYIIMRHKVIKAQKQDKSDKKQTPKLIEHEDYYMNEQGLMVFTEKYHLKRGYCCESGCLHCPYGFNKLS